MSFQIAKYFKAQSQLFHCKVFSQISRFGVSVLPLVIFRETLSPRPASIHSLLVSNSCAVGVSLPVNPYKTCHLILPPQPQLLRSSPWSIFFFFLLFLATSQWSVTCTVPILLLWSRVLHVLKLLLLITLLAHLHVQMIPPHLGVGRG
jgi:hypothetical protein